MDTRIEGGMIKFRETRFGNRPGEVGGVTFKKAAESQVRLRKWLTKSKRRKAA